MGKRKSTWALLQELKPREGTPWLVMGDFNEVLLHHEKVGGRSRREKQMHNFREALVTCNPFDLGHKGDLFTWSNKHEDKTFTK